MPKLKIKKSVSKRFKVSKRGKVLRGSQMKGHLRSKKSKSSLRKKRMNAKLTGRFAKKIKMLLGA